jgi:hypothetical protein
MSVRSAVLILLGVATVGFRSWLVREQQTYLRRHNRDDVPWYRSYVALFADERSAGLAVTLTGIALIVIAVLVWLAGY